MRDARWRYKWDGVHRKDGCLSTFRFLTECCCNGYGYDGPFGSLGSCAGGRTSTLCGWARHSGNGGYVTGGCLSGCDGCGGRVSRRSSGSWRFTCRFGSLFNGCWLNTFRSTAASSGGFGSFNGDGSFCTRITFTASFVHGWRNLSLRSRRLTTMFAGCRWRSRRG